MYERIMYGEFKKRPHGSVSERSWVFVVDEDTRTLRLKSELFDLRVGYANQQHLCLWRKCLLRKWSFPHHNKKPTSRVGGKLGIAMRGDLVQFS